jgi:hypothetical protein
MPRKIEKINPTAIARKNHFRARVSLFGPRSSLRPPSSCGAVVVPAAALGPTAAVCFAGLP